MAIDDGHMTDHMAAFDLPITGLRAKMVDAALGDPKDGKIKPGGVKIPTPTGANLPGAFGGGKKGGKKAAPRPLPGPPGSGGAKPRPGGILPPVKYKA